MASASAVMRRTMLCSEPLWQLIVFMSRRGRSARPGSVSSAVSSCHSW